MKRFRQSASVDIQNLKVVEAVEVRSRTTLLVNRLRNAGVMGYKCFWRGSGVTLITDSTYRKTGIEFVFSHCTRVKVSLYGTLVIDFHDHHL